MELAHYVTDKATALLTLASPKLYGRTRRPKCLVSTDGSTQTIRSESRGTLAQWMRELPFRPLAANTAIQRDSNGFYVLVYTLPTF